MENFLFMLKDKLRVPRNLALAAAAAGLVLGLFIGYVLFPVKWTDASAANLRPDLRVEWLRNAITSYTLTNDLPRAKAAYNELGNTAEKTLKDLVKNPAFLNAEQINRFTSAVGSFTPNADSAESGTQDSGQVSVQPSEKSGSGGVRKLGILFLVLLIGGGVAVYYLFLKSKNGKQTLPLDYVPPQSFSSAPATGMVNPQAAQSSRVGTGYANPPVGGRPIVPQAKPLQQPKPVIEAAQVYGKPIAQFMTTYMYGDDLYDDLFSFDAPNGEFLGECGTSIASTQGRNEPKKVNALEVWLFDKNDVQTITKVMMSGDAFEDENLRSSLERKGEPVEAELGKVFHLDTATLHLEAKVVDLAYGALTSQPKGYFQRYSLELAVYRKNQS